MLSLPDTVAADRFDLSEARVTSGPKPALAEPLTRVVAFGVPGDERRIRVFPRRASGVFFLAGRLGILGLAGQLLGELQSNLKNAVCVFVCMCV